MRLGTFQVPGASGVRAGDVQGAQVMLLPESVSVLDVLRGDQVAEPTDDVHLLEDLTILAPYEPRMVFGIGLNYLAHARESGLEPPPEPQVFVKSPSSVAAPGAPIDSHGSRSLDYEAELAVIMGPNNAVAGYAIGNDISARDWQRADEEWWRAKGADGFCRFGPWITTVDEVKDARALHLRCWVNGELRQDAHTDDLIFSVDKLIDFISQTSRLEPGDLILTGTPAGVGVSMEPPRFLQAGDLVRIEIDGLGVLEHSVA